MFGLEVVISSIVSCIVKNPEVALRCLKIICDIAIGVLKGLDVLGPNCSIEELTDKAILAEEDGITPDSCGSFEEYMKKIDEYDIDPERAASITEEQRTQKTAELTTRFAKEVLNGFPVSQFLPLVCENPEYFTAEKIALISERIGKDKKVLGDDMICYFREQDRQEDYILKVEDVLIEIEQAINPKLSEEEALDNILEVCRKQV